MANKVPGSAGMTVLGDKSYEFYKDPVAFLSSNMEKCESRIFLSRLLNKPTVFVGSNEGAREILRDHGHCLELGYRSFMYDVLGENILFVDGERATAFREILMRILSHESFQNFQGRIDRCVQKAFERLSSEEPICAYTFFKSLTTEICLSVFLSIDFETSRTLADAIIHLTTEHWHGIISVPLNFRIPLVTSSSTFTKALEAKAKLLEIIDEKLRENSGGFPELVRNNFGDPCDARYHLLVFTTALVPKAMASLLTSFMVSTAGKSDLINECAINECTMNNVMLEVERLWPPFIGGRRLIRKDCSVTGYKLHKGHALVYLTHAAHRDPTVFSQPNEFKPDRWKTQNVSDKDKILSFGFGHRCCIGQKFVKDILHHILEPLCKNYSWELSDPDSPVEYKWLPVSRPKDNTMVKVEPKNT